MNFLYFSVPQVCAHLPSSLRDSAHAVPFVIARQCARRPLCHCEPVLRLVWQSRTRSNVSAGTRRFPRQCAHCLGMTERVSLRTNAHAVPFVIAFPVLRLVWQSRTRSNVSAGTRRFPRQCAHCRGNLRPGQPGQSAQRTNPDCFQRAKTPQNAIRHLRCMGSLMEGIIESSPV